MIELIYECIIAAMLGTASVLTVFSLTQSELQMSLIVPAALFWTLGPALFLRMKPRGKIIAAGITAAVLAGIVLSADQSELMLWAEEHRWLFLTAGIGAVCVVFAEVMNHIPQLRLIPVCLGTSVLLYCAVQQKPLHKAAVSLIYLFLVLSAAEWIQSGWKKEGNTDPRRHALLVMPFLAVLFAAILCIRTPAKAFDWKPVKDLFNDARSAYERLVQSLNLRESWVDGEGTVGFSEEGGIRSSVRSSDYVVFEITSGTALSTRVYLSGRSFDTFDGRQWHKTDESTENYRMYDLLETTASAALHEPEHMPDYMRSSSLEIRLTGIRTQHVFLPGKSVPSIRDKTTEQIGGDLYFSNRRTRSYTVDFYRLNRAYEGFSELLKEDYSDADLLDPEILKTVGNTLQRQDLSGYTREGLLAYREQIKTVYGKQPELSGRMKVFLDELLEGADSDYEKLTRIESAFGAMEYTDSPGELPAYVTDPAEFADYFFFESRRGYCTHFASTFVLMAREAGIPARYVQGYCFTTSASGVTDVSSNTAHAWPEAYIEGFGWIDFDPTPGFLRVSGWKVRDHQARSDGAGVTIAVETEEEDEEESTVLSSGAEDMEPVHSASRSGLASLRYMLVFLAVYVLCDLIIRRFRYRRKKSRDKIVYLFRRCLLILKRMRLSVENGETLSEFAARASGRVPLRLLDFIPLYERIIYGETEPSQEEIRQLETNRRELFRYWIEHLFRKPQKNGA